MRKSVKAKECEVKECESGAGSASLAAESSTDISSLQKTGIVTLTGTVLPSGRSAGMGTG